MRQYYIYSGTLHAALLIFVFFAARPFATGEKKANVYSIDFIGNVESAPLQAPTPTIVTAQTKPAQPKAKTSDEIALKPKKRKPVVLPSMPSVLRSLKAERPVANPAAVEAPPSLGGVSAEFPNFPYPWYITQVRAALWNEWASRMPRGGMLSCTVIFRVVRNGTISGASIEKTSGNKLFDFAALSSAEQAAPFPPLPSDYKDKELTVHVEFRAAE
ncbi:MAG: TonB family protein [Elusimicrobia bacterium]|nr:TonB family protein [Elusimicrobiota bacterium]